MHVRVVPAKQGWMWIKQGWQVFRRQPMALTAILAAYALAMLVVVSALVNLVEAGLAKLMPLLLAQAIARVAGTACFAVTAPGVTAGFMEACRRVVAKQPLRLGVLIQPFREDRRIRRNLLVLGFVQVIALILVIALSPNLAPDLPSQTPRNSASSPASPSSSSPNAQPPRSAGMGAGDKSAPHVGIGAEAGRNAGRVADSEQTLAERKKALLVGLFQMILYLPVGIVLWYAPMLVYWQGYGASKAMFFSAAAVWRNRGAFMIYGLGLVGCLVAAYAIAALLVLLGLAFGAGKFSVALLAPFMTYCTIYITYTSVFVDPAVVENRGES